MWVHNADCCDLNITPNGKTLPKGESIFNTKDGNGQTIAIYKGKDGQWYRTSDYNKTDARPYNIPDVPKVQTRHYTYANDRKVNGANVGDVFRTPDTHPGDFLSKGANKINKYTGEIWQKSHTSHTDKMGEWKIGINGKPPTRTKKITIEISDGKLSKLKNSQIFLKNIDFDNFRNSRHWVGYFKAENINDLHLINESTMLLINFFKENLTNFFLLSALTENPDYESYGDLNNFDILYDKLFTEIKSLKVIQEYNDDFKNYFENDEKLNIKLINIHFDIDISTKICELLMFYYFNRIWGQVCFLINPVLGIALYPHEDIGYGCISLNGDKDLLIGFLKFCNEKEYFISYFDEV